MQAGMLLHIKCLLLTTILIYPYLISFLYLIVLYIKVLDGQIIKYSINNLINFMFICICK